MLQGLLHDQILASMLSKPNLYKPEILNALKSLLSAQALPELKNAEVVTQEELEIGMLLVEPIKDTQGTLILQENTYITRTILIELLKAGNQPNLLVEPFKVIRKRDW